MQESRLFKIVYYLLEKGRATAPELSEKFEVSVRTIYRDIDAISSVGIPIYATQGKGGGISILDHFVLDKSLFSETEREQIMMALQGITAVEGFSFDELLTKLGALFQIKSTNWIEVDFSNWNRNDTQQDVFHTIKNAIFSKHLLSFKYYSGGGDAVKRRVQPGKLIFKSMDWYLYGYCLLKHDYRFFKLTRIKELEALPETFSQDCAEPVVEKRIKDVKTVTVTLKFDKRAAFRVYDEFTAEVTVDEQGYLHVRTDLPDNEKMYSYILSYADCAEVLEPQRVREQVQTKLQDIQNKYK